MPEVWWPWQHTATQHAKIWLFFLDREKRQRQQQKQQCHITTPQHAKMWLLVPDSRQQQGNSRSFAWQTDFGSLQTSFCPMLLHMLVHLVCKTKAAQQMQQQTTTTRYHPCFQNLLSQSGRRIGSLQICICQGVNLSCRRCILWFFCRANRRRWPLSL